MKNQATKYVRKNGRNMNRREFMMLGLAGGTFLASRAYANRAAKMERIGCTTTCFNDFFPATRNKELPKLDKPEYDLLDLPAMMADRLGTHNTYARIFLDKKHNRAEQPFTDCFRCHGMLYDGNIGDLVEPLDNQGPWKLKQPEWSDKPTIPCLVCHKVHSGKQPTGLQADIKTPQNDSINRDGLAHFVLYNRNIKSHLSGKDIIVPDFYEAGRRVKMSSDPRHKLCIQCHAPDPQHQVGTSDDRTPKGVHEGLSCLACHKPHSGETRKSCANCHPALSNCGLDVTIMNTTFNNPNSPHNIHFVSCKDCHTEGVPSKKAGL